MSAESHEQESPLEEIERYKEIARNALKMADFSIGDHVNNPHDNTNNKEWIINDVSLFTINDRTVPGVILHNPKFYQIATVSLQDLCNANPKIDSRASLDDELTRNKIIYLTKINGHHEEKAIIGKVTNGPITVGKSIESTLRHPSAPVTSIICENGQYIIRIENDDSIYVFNPSESQNAFETD